MQGRQDCTQLLVRSRQGFPADRPTLLGVVAGRHCLAGGNLSKQREKCACETGEETVDMIPHNTTSLAFLSNLSRIESYPNLVFCPESTGMLTNQKSSAMALVRSYFRTPEKTKLKKSTNLQQMKHGSHLECSLNVCINIHPCYLRKVVVCCLLISYQHTRLWSSKFGNYRLRNGMKLIRFFAKDFNFDNSNIVMLSAHPA